MCIRFLVVVLSVAIQISQAAPVSGMKAEETLALQIVESRQNGLFPASRDYVGVLANSGKESAAIESVQMPGGYSGSGRFYPCSLFWNASNHKWMTPRPAKLSDFGKKPSVIEIKLKPGEKLEVCNSLLPQQQGHVGDSVRFALSLKWGHGPTLFSKKFTILGQNLKQRPLRDKKGFISAQNAGTNCAATTVNGKTEYWGNSCGYDAWGNLLQKSVTKCSAENFSVAALVNNRLSGYSYDAAGNMTNDGLGHAFTFDAESRIAQANSGAVNYVYDGDGNRVRKDVSGQASTEYYYFGGNIIAEVNLSTGAWTDYVFFDGERVARRDGTTGPVSYYFSDHLKTASVITDSAGVIKAESDYYPWGGELQFVNNDSNHFNTAVWLKVEENQWLAFPMKSVSSSMA